MTNHIQTEIFTIHGMETPQGFIALRKSEGTFSNRSVISFDGEVLTVNLRENVVAPHSMQNWQSFDFNDLAAGTENLLDNNLAGPSVPAYALGHLAIELAKDKSNCTFIHLQEFDNERTLAELTYIHDDETFDFDGILHSKAAHYSLSVGGQKSHDYWISNGILVRTDWPMATSLYTRNPGKVLDQLPQLVADALADELAA